MSKSVRVGKTRVGVSVQKRSDGRGRRVSLYSYTAQTNRRRK